MGNSNKMKKVIMFTTPTCHYCKDVKKFFDDNNISYTTYDVASDLEKRKEMMEKSGQMGVPVIIIDDQDVVVGYNKKVLSKLLDIKNE